MPSQKVAEMIKFIKERFAAVTEKTSSPIDQSSLVHNLKRVVRSSKHLQNIRADSSHNFSTPELYQMASSDLHALKPDEAFETLTTVGDSTVLPSTCLNKYCSQGSKSMSSTVILFSPSKAGITSGSGRKLKLKFIMRKNNLVAELPEVKAAISNVPVITLTIPDDEQTYMLYRPIPPISFGSFLVVPTPTCLTRNTAEHHQVIHKRWPHPAGPWLRLTSTAESDFRIDSPQCHWMEGWRLSTGRVIGWDPECIEALGISLPPQLPTERDLQTLALVEQISMSLDQAQDALYGSLGGEWQSDQDDEDYKPKIPAPSREFASGFVSYINIFTPDTQH